MKQIVMFPGHVVNPFFENEIDYVKRYFSIAAVLAYGDPKDASLWVFARHGIPKEKLYFIPHVSCGLWRQGFTLLGLFSWLRRKEVRAEIKEHCLKGRGKIKRLLHVLHYGGYALSAERIVRPFCSRIKRPVLYSFWMDEGAYAIAYLASKKYFAHAKLICRAHRVDLYEEINKQGYLPFRSYINKSLDCISFISGQGKNYFTAKFPDGGEKIVSYLGVKGNGLIKKQIFDKEEICIASCSYVKQEKRLDLIISVLAHLDGMKIRWIHLGVGPLLGFMKELAKKELGGRSIRWEFLGYVDNPKISRIYQTYDVDFLINLSDSEGLPVSVMEAFSMGIPAIARSVGGMREILSGKSGLLLQEKWVDDNYEKIRKFISLRFRRTDAYRKLSQRCYEVWKERFDAEKNYVRFFETL